MLNSNISIDLNGEIWDCNVDPLSVKDRVCLELNRCEIKFLIHTLTELKANSENELERLKNKYNYLVGKSNLSDSEVLELDSLNDMQSVEYSTIQDLNNIINKLLK